MTQPLPSPALRIRCKVKPIFCPTVIKTDNTSSSHINRQEPKTSPILINKFTFSGTGNSLLSISLPLDAYMLLHTHTHAHTLTVNTCFILFRAPQMMQRRWCGGRRTGSLLRRAGWGKLRKLTAYTWWGDLSLQHTLKFNISFFFSKQAKTEKMLRGIRFKTTVP